MMQRGLVEGLAIESASAIRAARAVVNVAYEREWTSRCDQVTNSSWRSPAPPWQPLVEHEFEPSVATPPAGAAPSEEIAKN
jgi:hypothetical protein